MCVCVFFLCYVPLSEINYCIIYVGIANILANTSFFFFSLFKRSYGNRKSFSSYDTIDLEAMNLTKATNATHIHKSLQFMQTLRTLMAKNLISYKTTKARRQQQQFQKTQVS